MRKCTASLKKLKVLIRIVFLYPAPDKWGKQAVFAVCFVPFFRGRFQINFPFPWKSAAVGSTPGENKTDVFKSKKVAAGSMSESFLSCWQQLFSVFH